MFDPANPPELAVTRWVNSTQPVTLASLRDKVVVLVAFQMLCPGCVEHALPQARRLRARFHPDQVAIIGLHTVFEHHEVMTPAALEVFMSEYKWPFPVGIDTPDGDGPPKTMTVYQMQGTPTLLLFDRAGRLRRHYFGRSDDIMLAAEIMGLALEDKGSPHEQASAIERKIAATLVAGHDHDHDHDHGHGHDHGHAHGHHHHHGHACGCDHDHGHSHHAHDHAHDGACGHDHCCGAHAHDHDHQHGHDHAHRLASAKVKTEVPDKR